MCEERVSSCSLFPHQLQPALTLEAAAPLDLFSSLRPPLVPPHMTATQEQLHIKHVLPLSLSVRHQVFDF